MESCMKSQWLEVRTQEQGACIIRYKRKDSNQNLIVRVEEEKQPEEPESLRAYLARVDRGDLPPGKRWQHLSQAIEQYSKAHKIQLDTFKETVRFLQER